MGIFIVEKIIETWDSSAKSATRSIGETNKIELVCYDSRPLPVGNQTWLAGKSQNLFDDFPIQTPFIIVDVPLKMEVLLGKSSINGPFSMAMLSNQRVYI